MANKEEMLKVIYEKIARKDLEFGCKVKVSGYEGQQMEYGRDEDKGYFEDILQVTGYCIGENDDYPVQGCDECDYTIIGHPVMIGDVLQRVDNNIGMTAVFDEAKALIYRRQYKSKSIDEQPNECIEYVYNLAL